MAAINKKNFIEDVAIHDKFRKHRVKRYYTANCSRVNLVRTVVTNVASEGKNNNFNGGFN